MLDDSVRKSLSKRSEPDDSIYMVSTKRSISDTQELTPALSAHPKRGILKKSTNYQT